MHILFAGHTQQITVPGPQGAALIDAGLDQILVRLQPEPRFIAGEQPRNLADFLRKGAFLLFFCLKTDMG